MKKALSLYLFLPIFSYCTGLTAYALLFTVFYNESVTDWSQLMIWTAPVYLIFNSACFMLSYVLLNTFQKYSFWTQTLLFVISSAFLVYLIPFMSGIFIIRPNFIFTREGLSFYVLFGIASVTASYILWRAHQRRV